MFAWDIKLLAGRGPWKEKNTVVHESHPPSSLTLLTTSELSSSLLRYVEGGGRGGADERVCCRFGKAAARYRPPDSQSPRSGFYSRCGGGALSPAQQAELCASASREAAANLQIPGHTRRFPSAHKLLLIKPVPLITGRTIKSVSRCFRSSLWALLKAGEASDQGCWPRGAGAGPLLPGRAVSKCCAIRPHSFARPPGEGTERNY